MGATVHGVAKSWTRLSDFTFFLSSIYSNADIISTSTDTPNADIITSTNTGPPYPHPHPHH